MPNYIVKSKGLCISSPKSSRGISAWASTSNHFTTVQRIFHPQHVFSHSEEEGLSEPYFDMFHQSGSVHQKNVKKQTTIFADNTSLIRTCVHIGTIPYKANFSFVNLLWLKKVIFLFANKSILMFIYYTIIDSHSLCLCFISLLCAIHIRKTCIKIEIC